MRLGYLMFLRMYFDKAIDLVVWEWESQNLLVLLSTFLVFSGVQHPLMKTVPYLFLFNHHDLFYSIVFGPKQYRM